MAKNDKAGAITALRSQIEVSPNDQCGRLLLAGIYLKDEKYEEVIPVLQPIADSGVDDGKVLGQLGLAYLKSGNKEKALGIFERWLKIDAKPVTKNSVAYLLADNDSYIDRALELAKQSVSEHSANLHKLELSNLTMENVTEAAQLVAAWDTLGWAYFKNGQIEPAIIYLRAAWVAEQKAEIAKHLAALYDRLGMRTNAAEYRSYESSLKPKTGLPGSIPPHLPPTARRGGARPERSIEERLQDFRTLRLSQTGKKGISSEFFVLLTSNGAEEVKFVGNPGAGATLKDALTAAKYPLELPDDKAIKMVRRGIVHCSEYAGCMVMLLQPFDVKSLD